MTSINDILMGGGGAPSAKLVEGTTIAGRITAISEPYQEREYDKFNPGQGDLKFFKNGNPIMTFNVDVATSERDPDDEDDDGTRRIYMDGSRIKKAVKAAVLAAGATGLNVGGHLSITCTHYDTPGDIRSGKNYSATYTPAAPANGVLMGQHEANGHTPTPTPVAPAPAPVATVPAPDAAQVAAVKQAGLDPKVVFAASHPAWVAAYTG